MPLHTRWFPRTERLAHRIRDGYFFVALIFAHLARFAALIRANPAAEMRRLGVIETTFCWPFTLAQRALCAALIRARPAGEMCRRLGTIETTFWPRVRAQRALCEAEILARAAALILRRPCVAPVLFIPLRALIAVSNAFTCCAALSLSAFNSAIMSILVPRGEDSNRVHRA